MKIEKFKKIGKSKYKIYYSGNETVLYEDVILKYNLLVNQNITLDMLNKILEENKYYEVYNLALNYIAIKMRNKEEIKKYLLNKNFEATLIENVTQKLESEGYLNETEYVKAYVNDKVNLSLDGPYKIKQSLLHLKMDESLVDEILEKIDNEIWCMKINKIIEKRKKTNKKLSTNSFKMKTKIYLYNLGYPEEMINDNLSNIEMPNENIDNDYKKALQKYNKKYDGEKLKYQIKNYLYKKGYSIEEINNKINP